MRYFHKIHRRCNLFIWYPDITHFSVLKSSQKWGQELLLKIHSNNEDHSIQLKAQVPYLRRFHKTALKHQEIQIIMVHKLQLTLTKKQNKTTIAHRQWNGKISASYIAQIKNHEKSFTMLQHCRRSIVQRIQAHSPNAYISGVILSIDCPAANQKT